jgi:hypothetical protein
MRWIFLLLLLTGCGNGSDGQTTPARGISPVTAHDRIPSIRRDSLHGLPTYWIGNFKHGLNVKRMLANASFLGPSPIWAFDVPDGKSSSQRDSVVRS